MNGYNYANNSPVTLSDPDGLRPIGPTDSVCGDEEYAEKHHGSQWTNNGYGWYWKNVQQTKIQGHGTVTVTTYIGRGTANHPAPRGSVTLQPIKPKAKEVTVHPWMGGGTYKPSVTYTPSPLNTWQKIILGIVTGVSAGVILAPIVLALGPEVAATGGAAGGSMPAGKGFKALPVGKGGQPEVATLYGPFHRKASPTQLPKHRDLIVNSGELWGTYPKTGGGPTAQAHLGAMPENAVPGSLEFYTAIPSSVLSKQTGYVGWEAGKANVREFVSDGKDIAGIPIIITGVR
ncbi:RHS repeat-associated core domain-containing protein [Streptomyces anulatus]|uniref:hypothetical protein n=1 Tax=Streptomyces anulatus TaxID=1892 RepID=UPI00365D5817